MTIDRSKYVVFKRDDMIGMLNEAQAPVEVTGTLLAMRLEDAVVIRKKDIFAASALYSYATAVHSAIELLEVMQAGVVVDESVLEHLAELADYFAGEADHARQLNGRIPC